MFAFIALSSPLVFGGPERPSGKEMKQTAVEQAPCPQWYADNEWNISVWGAYAFTGENWENDRYLDADHAWGGGIDLKYFFHRYFGIGVEGFVLDASREVVDESGTISTPLPDASTKPISIPGFSRTVAHDDRAIGAVMGTFTFRYPLPCSRFAPYVWVGGGAIFNGGERDRVHVTEFSDGLVDLVFSTTHTQSETKALGQFGGGLEFRFTPHLGWMNDFSWNVVDGSNNNFGMVRSGLTFAF